MESRLTDRQRRNIARMVSSGACTRQEAARNFGVGVGAIDYALGMLGATTRRNARWTDAEDAFVRENYQTVGAEGCLKVLGRHTLGSIQKRASVLGVTDRARAPLRWRVVEGGDHEQPVKG